MDQSGKIAIVLTGHLLTDQRILKTSALLHENNYNICVYYRRYYKFLKPADESVNTPYPTVGLDFSVNSGVLFYLLFNLRIFFKLLFKSHAAYVAVDSDTLPALTLLSYIRNTPLIFDSHEYFAEVPELEGRYFKKDIWHWVTQAGINRSHARYTVSETLAAELQRRYGQPFEVVRNVPAYHPQSLQEKLDPPVILYQGALNEGRKLELLIDAMRVLPEFNCIIIGEGDLSAALRARAHGLKNVTFKGLLSPDNIRHYTYKCFAGYNLLDAGSKSYYYSLSNKYFDYMQAGIPSISSKLPEYETLNERHGCGICIDNTVQELVNTLKQWRNDENTYRNMSQNALLASLKNNWETESGTLLKIYKNL